MHDDTQHLTEFVTRQYPGCLRPTKIEPLGMAGGMSGAQFWRVHSPAGIFVLRRWPAEHPTADRLRFIHAVLFHAAAQGIDFLAVPVRTSADSSFVFAGERLWKLSPWLRGAADFEQNPTNEKLKAALRSLARFHDSVKGLASTENATAPAIARHLKRLKKVADSGISSMLRAVDATTWPELAPLAKRFCAVTPESVRKVLTLLEPMGQVSFRLQPCLRDVWHDHVLFVGDDVSGIIDYGAMDIDTPATDVARLLGSLVGDNAEGWGVGLRAYLEVRPLSSDEAWAAKALDMSGTLLAGVNWLQWIFVEGRTFDDRAQIVKRFSRIAERCERIGRL
jgi:Ser/Thr protein kinase RdoA (MazF antagonist)